MSLLVRFALHGACDRRYQAAFDVLAALGLDPLERPAPGPPAGRGPPCRQVFPAAAVGGQGDPATVARAAFVALQEARLRPVAVSSCPLEPAEAA
jgi:hypothetical protein